jgi:hypothetical protein
VLCDGRFSGWGCVRGSAAEKGECREKEPDAPLSGLVPPDAIGFWAPLLSRADARAMVEVGAADRRREGWEVEVEGERASAVRLLRFKLLRGITLLEPAW